MKAERAQWLVNRLRCMGPGEIAYRLRQAGVTMLERRGWNRAGAPASSVNTPAIGVPAMSPEDREALLAEAVDIRAGRVTLFARTFDVGAAPEWNRDPATGTVAPAVFGGDIDVTDRAVVGDIKHLWELNRHLHLVKLAQAALASGDPCWLRALAAQLRGWLDQCPPLRGPNWTSALELGVRLLNWSLLWRMAGDALCEADPTLRADWLRSIHAHCAYIERHLSRHSSANNHLIGELAGLFVAASTWPCWKESSRWRVLAAKELEQEAQRQFSRDGVHREQAFGYHVFSTELLVAAGLAGQPFSSAYWESVRGALRFLRSVRDIGGNVPMVGDADGAAAWPGGFDRAGELLALCDGAPHWIRHALPGELPELAGEPAWAFPEGGYLLFGDRFGEAREIKGMVDCGPLGYLGIAAHGHADALAITLSVGGEECLADPGTWSYWRERKWRDYFRGTSAHNTVRVDGLDQSVGGGRFLWLKKAAASIERMPDSPGDFDFTGSHDGYLRLSDPVRHRRSVRFDAAGATLVVRDELVAKRAHKLEQFWHFAPGMAVQMGDACLLVKGRAFALLMRFSGPPLTLDLVRGSEDPPLGWYARGYEMREPCDVLKITTLLNGVPVECRITITFFN